MSSLFRRRDPNLAPTFRFGRSSNAFAGIRCLPQSATVTPLIVLGRILILRRLLGHLRSPSVPRGCNCRDNWHCSCNEGNAINNGSARKFFWCLWFCHVSAPSIGLMEYIWGEFLTGSLSWVNRDNLPSEIPRSSKPKNRSFHSRPDCVGIKSSTIFRNSGHKIFKTDAGLHRRIACHCLNIQAIVPMLPQCRSLSKTVLQRRSPHEKAVDARLQNASCHHRMCSRGNRVQLRMDDGEFSKTDHCTQHSLGRSQERNQESRN